MKHYLYVLVALLFLGCSGKTPTATNTEEVSNIIDISSGLKNIQAIKLSEIADSVTFIPFETNQQSLHGQGQSTLIDFSPLYIFYWDKCYDWTGKYLCTIGKRGQGTFEEPMGIHYLVFSDNHFYTKGMKIIEYDITGKPTGKLTTFNSESNNFLQSNSSNVFSISGNNFINFHYPTDVYFINKNLEIESSRKVIDFFNEGDRSTSYLKNRKFITGYKDNSLFYNFINDTIFYIKNTDLEPKWIVNFDDPSRLSPEIVLKFGKILHSSLTPYIQGQIAIENTDLVKLTDNKHFVSSVYETESFLFFQMKEIINLAEQRGKEPTEPYIVLFDKRTGNTMRIKGNGFVDDILGMDIFYPILGVYDEKLITYIWPFELLKYIDECREKGKEVSPQLLALSKKVDAEDNPILILAHLKSNYEFI